MEYKLILVPQTPDEFVLNAETPLQGLAFVEVASACLRRNLDNHSRMRHTTLGNAASYTISVPQALAIESGWFSDKSVRYLPCEANVLAKYIFYGANMAKGATNRPCYPYYQDEIVLASYIDELAFLDVWRNRGYPEKMTINYDGFNIDLVPDADDVTDANPGDLVLDDLYQGVDSIMGTNSSVHVYNLK